MDAEKVTAGVPPYIPYGAADALMGCKDREVLIEGPAGTGKSVACLTKLHYACQKYPGIRCLLLRQTRESMTQSLLVSYETKVLPANSPIAAGAQRESRSEYRYPNGSVIVVGGIRASGRDNVAKLMSTEYDIAYVGEAAEISEENWEKILSRLRNYKAPFQQAIADTNPDRPTHWLNARANRPYKLPEGVGGLLPPPRPGQTQMTRLLSRHRDNPFMYDRAADTWTPEGAAYLATLAGLTGPRRLRLLEGKWAAAEGLVYEDYDPAVHHIDPVAIPATWVRFRAIDFGYTNPCVCQWWAADGDGRLYLYREWVQTRTLVEDFARAIMAWEVQDREAVRAWVTNDALAAGYLYADANAIGAEAAAKWRYAATVADHDAEDRATLGKYGVHTVPAFKAISPGINAVAARFRVADDNKPRLFIFKGSLVARDEALAAAKKPLCMAEELEAYSWPKAEDGKPVKEEPVKVDDHAVDAARYAIAWYDKVGPTVEVRVIRPGGSKPPADPVKPYTKTPPPMAPPNAPKPVRDDTRNERVWQRV